MLKRKFPSCYEITGRGRRKEPPSYRLYAPSSYFFLRLALFCLTFLYKRRNKASRNEKHRLCNNIFSVSLVASASFISYPAISASQIFISPIANENCGSRLKFINRYRCPCLLRSKPDETVVGLIENFIKILAKIHPFVYR